MEDTSATSTDSPLDIRGEMCGRCHVSWNLATGAGSFGERRGRDNHAGGTYGIPVECCLSGSI